MRDSLERDLGRLDEHSSVERERVGVNSDIPTLGVRGEHSSGRSTQTGQRTNEVHDSSAQNSATSTPRPLSGRGAAGKRTYRSAAEPMWALAIPALRSSVEWAAEREVNGVEAVEPVAESVSPFLGLAALAASRAALEADRGAMMSFWGGEGREGKGEREGRGRGGWG